MGYSSISSSEKDPPWIDEQDCENNPGRITVKYQIQSPDQEEAIMEGLIQQMMDMSCNVCVSVYIEIVLFTCWVCTNWKLCLPSFLSQALFEDLIT